VTASPAVAVAVITVNRDGGPGELRAFRAKDAPAESAGPGVARQETPASDGGVVQKAPATDGVELKMPGTLGEAPVERADVAAHEGMVADEVAPFRELSAGRVEAEATAGDEDAAWAAATRQAEERLRERVATAPTPHPANEKPDVAPSRGSVVVEIGE
jgi:hypothetical protein